MTQKDFILLAEIILNMGPEDGVHGPNCRKRIAEAFARGLKQTNGQFKPELFIQAATGECPSNARRVR